jgi:hypothetical protein
MYLAKFTLEAVDIKDWLLHQGPKFDKGLPLLCPAAVSALL